MAAFPKRYADLVARLRVPSGFILVAAFAWLSHPSSRSLAAGVPLSLLGLLVRGWAAGHLAKNKSLARSGPYAHVRNPLYVGTLLVAAGLVVASRNWILAGIFAAVFLLVYLPVIELEEQHLRNLFPEYAEYARSVPALWPSLHGAGAGGGFQWSLYRRNEEYQALMGFVVGVVFLVVKLLWF
ncbi:MAG TPA: isoprenylcysteine carboxylmethyltransferase family protein [Bryobacteraceae bacterium]|nr:isoprenylcysteine carboxylmethyltransferase family protein [Bryobacteraceae bacterium]